MEDAAFELPPLQMKAQWRETPTVYWTPRNPDLESALRGVMPKARKRLLFPVYWREGSGGGRRPASPSWLEHGEEPVILLGRIPRRGRGPLSRSGLVIGSVPGYHANHGASDMPYTGLPSCWSHSETSHPLGEPRLSSRLGWKAVAALPARVPRAAAMAGMARVQPDAAGTPMLWREPLSALPCQAPGKVPAVVVWRGTLARAASCLALTQSGRVGTAARQPADWKKPATPAQNEGSRTCRLPESCAATPAGAARVLSRAAWMTPAAWRTATPRARPDTPRQAFGEGPGGHWVAQPDRAAAEPAAAAHNRLPRFGFQWERERSSSATAAGDSGGTAGATLQGGLATAGHAGFCTGWPASRRPQRAAACLARPERTATGPSLDTPPPAGAAWQTGSGECTMPGQAYGAPNKLTHGSFWPATTFAGGPPEAVRQPARGTRHQTYVWMPAVVVPAGRPIKLGHVLHWPAVRTAVAGRIAEASMAPSPAASWRSPEPMHVGARLAPATPSRTVPPDQWKPDCRAFRMAGRRADLARVEAAPAGWSSATISGSTVRLPVCGAVFWLSGLGRRLELGTGAGPARVAATGAEPPHHPERLKLPHLVCRFPRTDPGGNKRIGGVGSSVFRFSGMSREDSSG